METPTLKRLRVISPLKALTHQGKGLSLRVAFASDESLHTTGHFGRAKRFVVYRLEGASANLESVLSFQQHKASLHWGAKERIEALKGVDVIVASEIGPDVTAYLVRLGISPVKTKPGETIDGFLKHLIQAIQKDPPPWLKQFLAPKAEPPLHQIELPTHEA
jgi:nitrogen fixation protein NifX